MFERIREDIETAFQRDPAARTKAEVILTYPGLHALWLHRVAHWFWRRRRHLIARLISHINRALTGIEIHPGAQIGRRVFIDHGMGIVIGETAVVGNDVLMYQGVVLGGTSQVKTKRHPTVEDGVVIGAGAIVLGPITIGRNARIGAGSVVVKDVPAGATVVGVPAHLAGRRDGREETMLDHGELPDPVVRALSAIFERESKMEERLQELERTVSRLHELALPTAASTPPSGDLREAILDKLRTVLDPEVGVNLVDLGLIRDVRVSNGAVEVDMVLTSPHCPLAGQLVEQVRSHARAVPGVEHVRVTLLDEPWKWEWFVQRNHGNKAQTNSLENLDKSAADY